MAARAEVPPERLGLIAGYGSFPLELAASIRAQGIALHVVAVREETSASIEEYADSIQWLHVGQVGRMIRAFQQAGVTHAVMAGKVQKLHLFRNFRPDMTAIRGLARLADRRDDTILNAVAALLAESGIELVSQLTYAGEMLAGQGRLMGSRPDDKALRDMEFGFRQARGIAALDIGQTVVVQDGAVLAVEAIEGTDDAIRRGGALGNGRAVVVKVAKPGQDTRFDVPAVGPDTLHAMHAAGCRALAVQAGLTLLLERARLAAEARRLRIPVVGLEAPS